MTDHIAKRAREIYLQLSTLDQSALEAELDRLSGGDAKLKDAVVSLIDAQAHADQDDFMSSPTAGTTAMSATITESAGSAIGPYKLLQLIGEGGFGSVFLAEQARPVRRRAALKIIKLGMDTKQVIARFEAERQALAMMDHPHIARVYDAGATDTGRPYFAMEYVVGDAITKFADAHKLDIPSRLALFAQACSAVQHAHTKGVIHRDLKPANVLVSMVDGKPYAKVIDFGIAKATASPLTEKTLFTEHRQLIGTPEYMSPEQAEGSPDIDTRTDVYALGVLLYELLTGVTPFDAKRLRSAAFGEMQRIIKEEDPPAPSLRLTRNLESLAKTAMDRKVEPTKLSNAVRGELDWIVMKSLDKDRARRYESAAQLATDIGNHLAGDAVVAAPPSRGYRLRKFVRRNRGAVIAGSAVSAAILLGLAGTAWGWNAARQSNKDLSQNLSIARESLLSSIVQTVEFDEGERLALMDEMGITESQARREQANAFVEGIRQARKHLAAEEGRTVDPTELNDIAMLSFVSTMSVEEIVKLRDKLRNQADIARNGLDEMSRILNDYDPQESPQVGEVALSTWNSHNSDQFPGESPDELRLRALMAYATGNAKKLVAESNRSSRIAQAVAMMGDVQNEYVANMYSSYSGNLADGSEKSSLQYLMEALDEGLLADAPEAEFPIRSALSSLLETSTKSDAIDFCLKSLQKAEQRLGSEHPISIRLLVNLVRMHDQNSAKKDETILAEARSWYGHLRQRLHAVRGDLPEHDTRQWASELISYSSQYDDTNWTAAMVLGEPDAFSYTDHEGAWTPVASSRKFEHVTVGFEQPVFATGVMVRQVLNNGFVRLIEVIDLGGELHPVWAGEDTSERGMPYDFVARFERTPFAVQGVRVTIDANHASTYEEVDAIELIGFAVRPDEIQADPEVRALASTRHEQAMRLVGPIVQEALANAPTLKEAEQRVMNAPDLDTAERNKVALAFSKASMEVRDLARTQGEQFVAQCLTLDRSIAKLDRTDGLTPIMRDEIRKELQTLAQNSIYAINERIWRTVHVPGASKETLAIALEEALKLTEAYPDSPNYRFTLGATQYRLGEFESALASLTESRRLYGSRVLTLDHLFLAMVYAKLGRDQEALDIFLNWDIDLRSTDTNTENGRIYTETLEVLGPILRNAGIDASEPIAQPPTP